MGRADVGRAGTLRWLPTVTLVALAWLALPPHARAQLDAGIDSETAGTAEAPLAPRRVLLLRPATGAAPPGLAELHRSLRAMLGPDAELSIVTASLPDSESEDPRAWGASVARSEGADAVLWIEPQSGGDRVTLWVVHAEEGRTAAAIEVDEPRLFDRGRTLALAARPLLEATPEAYAGPSDSAPEGTGSVGEEPPASDLDAEEAARRSPAADSPAADSPAPSSAATREPGTPPPTDGPPSAPADSAEGEPDDASPPRAQPEWPEAIPELALRLLIGPALRGDGPNVGVRGAVELTFARWAWVRVGVELVRREDQLALGVDAYRERIPVTLSAGAQLAWDRLRARLGPTLSLVPVWLSPDGAGVDPELAVTVGGTLAAAVVLADALFLEVPLSVEGTVSGQGPEWLAEVEVTVALLLGISIE